MAFGHGRSLREAMACGNVGFSWRPAMPGWCRRRVRQRGLHHGCLPALRVPEPDPRVIARDLARLDDDRELLVSLRRRARAIAEKFFDVRVMVSRTLELYRSVLAGRPTPPTVADPSPAPAGRRGGGGLLKVVVRD